MPLSRLPGLEDVFTPYRNGPSLKDKSLDRKHGQNGHQKLDPAAQVLNRDR